MKKIIWQIIRVGLSVGILVYIFSQPDTSLPKIISTLSTTNLLYLMVAFMILGIAVFSGIIRWYILLISQKIYISSGKVFQFAMIGLFFNNIMPSLTGGDIIKGYYIFKNTHKKTEALTSIAMDRLLGLIALLGYAVIGSIYLWNYPKLRSLSLFILGVFGGVLCVGVLFFQRKFWEKFSFLNSWLEKLKIRQILIKIYDTIYAYKDQKKYLLIALILSFVVQGCMIGLNYFIALSIGIREIHFMTYFLFIPIATMISAIPISFGGWGIGETAYKDLFSIMGSHLSSAGVAISVVYRLGMLLYSLIGFPIYLIYKDHQPILNIENQADKVCHNE